MDGEKLEIAVYDTKPYDRKYLEGAKGSSEIKWRFFDFRLNDQVTKTAEGASIACVFVNDTLDLTCLEKLANLGIKLIALRCAGYNNVDIGAAKALKLSVIRVPAYSPHAVAEHAVGLLLALNRKIPRAFNRVRELNFSLSGLVGFDICGKTVGVVGTGKIGKIFAQILRGFDANVVAYDAYQDPEWANRYGVKYVSFSELLQSSNIISLHVPLLPETFHMLNVKTLAQMQPGSFIINTSRGRVIDTRALIAALKTGHIGGVALDTYEEEEGVFFEDLSGQVLLDDELSRLLTFPNVLITSHQGFLTDEALKEISRITLENIVRFRKKEPFLPGTSLVE